MASTASDSLPPSPAALDSAFLDGDHPALFLDQAISSFFPATTAQEPLLPPAAPASAARKPPRKRPRTSRRPPTTVLTTDTSNFHAMVQEFTGFPAPPQFEPHLGPGVLFGAAGSPPDPAAAGSRAPFELLMRPLHLKLPAALSTSPPTSSFAHSLFADSHANPAASAAATPSSSSELHSFFPPTLSGAAAPCYDGGFEAAQDEREHVHDLFSSFLHAGDRYQYHSH